MKISPTDESTARLNIRQRTDTSVSNNDNMPTCTFTAITFCLTVLTDFVQYRRRQRMGADGTQTDRTAEVLCL